MASTLAAPAASAPVAPAASALAAPAAPSPPSTTARQRMRAIGSRLRWAGVILAAISIILMLSAKRRQHSISAKFSATVPFIVKKQLEEKGWTLYAMKGCPACVRQMQTLEDSYGRVAYSDADVAAMGGGLPPYSSVTHFPTWVRVSPDGGAPEKIVGSKTLEQLAKL